jgi:hypothetical protein
MGLDTGALGPRICDRSSRGHPGMGTRVSIHRTACLSDLVRQRPLSASRGETRCDTYRNRHPCRFGAEDSRLETSAHRLTRKRTPPARPRGPSAFTRARSAPWAARGTFPNTGPGKRDRCLPVRSSCSRLIVRVSESWLGHSVQGQIGGYAAGMSACAAHRRKSRPLLSDHDCTRSSRVMVLWL